MATIHVTTHSRLSPERVLDAGHDFSARRAEIFPAVSTSHLEVHALSQTSAVVTDSNVYQPANSSWELRAAPAESGSKVEMIWIREFTHNAREALRDTVQTRRDTHLHARRQAHHQEPRACRGDSALALRIDNRNRSTST